MGELQMIFEPTPGKPPYAHMSVSHPSLPSLILQKNGLLALTLLFGVKWEVLCVSISLSPTSWPLA
jgi:hypothetical protein